MLPIEKLYMDNTYQNPPFFCSEPRKLPRLSTVCCNSTAAVRSWWAALSSTGLSNRNCSTFRGQKSGKSTGKSSTEKWWETCEKTLEIRWNSQDFLRRTWKIRWIVWKCVGFFRGEPGNSGYFDFLWVTRSFLDNFWPIFYGKSWGEDCINSRKE